MLGASPTAHSMANRSEQLQRRIATFAASVDTLIDRLPRDTGGQNAARQLAKCSTSPIANYGEACEAESPRDYIHKMKICLKELRETRGWLMYISIRSAGSIEVEQFEQECNELIAIFVTCVKKASGDK